MSHYFGAPPLRKQILFDVSITIDWGEIVILTGPSGSGKTTFLTLAGGLRSAQAGSLRVLGEEMLGASEAALVRVRRRIGYIFQAHNLLDALSASQNVQMALQLHPEISRAKRERRAEEALQAVGLGQRVHHFADQLSGGQKQRVAIARALVSQPKLILADEPTASLDKQSGREVVELMQQLAKERRCTVLLVTHDNRILDIADRIIHLEDGRLSSFTEAVLSNTRQLMGMLAQNNRRGDLVRRLEDLPVNEFVALLETVTMEFQHFLQVLDMSSHDAFESVLEQIVEAFTLKVGQVLDADRVTLLLVDRTRGELWSKVAQADTERPLELRFPLDRGIAGRVARSGEPVNLADAYADPEFNREVDERTGYRTGSLLCVPVRSQTGEVFAVAQLLNKRGAERFADGDVRRFGELATSIGVILESWARMRAERGG